MGTVIVVVILILIVGVAFRGSMKHFKGEGGCCGGGGEGKTEKKKLAGKVVAEEIIHIEGMQCENCKNRVERSLNEIDGVSAKVSLHRKSATVSMDRPVSDEILRKAVERLDFQVTEMERKEA